jgi:FMN phosphatase YigB (HAD superfamily)
MKLKTFHSVDKLVNYGNTLLEEFDTISFDVFDTLLVRRTHDPDLVKPPVAQYVADLAAAKGHALDWEAVQDCRDHHETALRKQTSETFVDHEARYELFMRSMLEELFQGDHPEDIDELYKKVRRYELRIENAMLVPRAGFTNWLEALHAQGKRILAISDMYLSAAEIEELLEHAGLLKYIQTVISSADSFLCKSSGKAYEMLMDKYELSPDRWIHVGDHPISDGIRAREAGLKYALILQDPEERRRKAIARHYWHYAIYRKFWTGRTLQQFMAPMEAENQPCSDMYMAGYNFFGPLMGVFIQSIAEHCKKHNISKIFFLSREGWMFKQVWEKVTPYLYPGVELPEIEYLYVSRMALAGASCAHKGLSQENADIVFLPAGNRDFRDVCRVFGLEAEAFTEHLQRYELEADTLLSHNYADFELQHRKNFYRLLQDTAFQNEIKRQTGPHNDALQRYLEASGFFAHDDIALVDIGWLGTIQRYLYSSIEHRKDRPNCHGLLFGATRGIPFDNHDKSHIKGLVYDPLGGDLPGSSILYAQDLFEEACRAPHPTLNAYLSKGETKYELQFREMSDAIGKAEQEQDEHYADLQRGILDAAGRFGPAAAIMMCDSGDYRAWINYLLVNKLAFPKRSEIQAMRFKHHLDDFHGSGEHILHRKWFGIFENPWQLHGWRLRVSSAFRGLLYKRHVRSISNRAAINEE